MILWIARYWKPLAVLALLTLTFALGYRLGTRLESAQCVSQQLAAAQAQAAALDAANARADAINEALTAELAKPGAGTVIREVIRNHPSDCVLAPPVAEAIRQAIKDTNEAIR